MTGGGDNFAIIKTIPHTRVSVKTNTSRQDIGNEKKEKQEEEPEEPEETEESEEEY